LADSAILVVAALVVAIVLRNRGLFFPAVSPSGVEVGQVVPIAGLDYGASERTFVLILNTRCEYCAQSAPFYRTLANECDKSGSVRIVAAFQERLEESRSWLDSLLIPVHQVIEIDPQRLGLRGTPTVLLVDSRGRLVDSWKGKLDAETQVEVLQRITK